MSTKYDDELQKTQELYDFLQDEIPKGTTVAKSHRPKLTADQAWTVIWYLGNLYWQVTDRVERCDVCGNLFHSHREGTCLDYGKAPYHFCDNCMSSEAYLKKGKRNPNKA